jgi:serine/threonine protein kinase
MSSNASNKNTFLQPPNLGGYFSSTIFPKKIGIYAVVGILGRGTFGTVYLVKNNAGVEFVLKVSNSQYRKNLVLEFTLGGSILNPSIVRPLELFEEGEFTCLLFEYVPGTTLTEYFEVNKPSFQDKMMLVLQLILAIAHLHQVCKLVHFDLKPDNILVAVDKNGFPVVKIIDFGLACLMKDLAPGAKGTFVYMAPEVAQGDVFDEKADIWSLGKIIAWIFTGKNVYPSGEHPYMFHLYHVANIFTPPIPNEMRTDPTLEPALLLCEACLRINPNARASAMDLLNICYSQLK